MDEVSLTQLKDSVLHVAASQQRAAVDPTANPAATGNLDPDLNSFRVITTSMNRLRV